MAGPRPDSPEALGPGKFFFSFQAASSSPQNSVLNLSICGPSPSPPDPAVVPRGGGGEWEKDQQSATTCPGRCDSVSPASLWRPLVSGVSVPRVAKGGDGAWALPPEPT